jgi:hypothetical protein
MPRALNFRNTRLFAIAFALLAVSNRVVMSAEPLHLAIDRMIAAKTAGPVAGRSTDAEFLRRVTLDFSGRIPSVKETRKFLVNRSPQKRVQLIDKLLSSPGYSQRMQELFHVILMERRGTHTEWTAYLKKSFEQNKPWDKISREILSPDADNKETRGAAFFLTKRLEKYGQNPVDFPGLTRDIGRLFLGVDLKCAQCHDHLHVDDYKQSMYQGLFAFVSTTYLRRDTKFPAVAERTLNKKIDFMSVFIKEPNTIGPQVPGDKEITIPVFKKGEEFSTTPDRKKRTPGKLKFSPLKQLGERLPRGDNKAFTKNIVNRLWGAMMGRGIVEPLDLHHSDNPPSHPKLLELLAKELVTHKFDLKYLLRELALTETYQRSGLLSDGLAKISPASFRVANEKSLSAEQLLRSFLLATGPSTAQDSKTERDASQKQYELLQPEFITAFGNTPREPEVGFNPSVKAALYVSNTPGVLGLLKPQPGNLADRLLKMKTTKEIADELYFAVLSRQPAKEEIETVTNHLKKYGKNREKAIGQLVWALLTSTEFCLNH